MSYTHLWLDIVAGLKKEGWKEQGGNFSNWIMMSKGERHIKVFLKDNKKLNQFDTNYIVVRYS